MRLEEARGIAGQLILVASTLHYDNLPSAVYSIQAEWSSGRSYLEKVANLTGVGSGPRSNSASFLIRAETVLDDAQVDQLLGAEDQDWFLADIDNDLVIDLAVDEEVFG